MKLKIEMNDDVIESKVLTPDDFEVLDIVRLEQDDELCLVVCDRNEGEERNTLVMLTNDYGGSCGEILPAYALKQCKAGDSDYRIEGKVGRLVISDEDE